MVVLPGVGVRKDPQEGSRGAMKPCTLLLKSERRAVVARGPCEDLGMASLGKHKISRWI